MSHASFTLFSLFLKTVGVGFLLLFFVTNTSFAQRPSYTQLGNMGSSGGTGTTARPTSSSPKRSIIKRDTIVSVIPDSIRSKENKLDNTVEYTAEDSTILDVANETIYLYGGATVLYGDIELKADFIKLDWGKNEVFAHGLPDTTRKMGEPVRGKPIFSQGGDDYNSDTIRYNFSSKRAIIKNIITQQGEGIIHGERVKKDSLDNMYLVDALYTTCNLKEPHFHIEAKKIKLIDKHNVVSGPFHLEVANIPLPVYLPFGFFPVPKNKEIGTSGFIMGQYGEEPRNRGFYFRDFGYYHAFNERIGVKVLGQIYSRGSWGAGVQSTYTKRYKYTGNLNFQFNWNKNGSVLAEKDDVTKDFNFSWSHSPQSRRPDRSFSASVNLQSNSYNQNNRQLEETNLYTNNTSGSSVQYTRSFFNNMLRTSIGTRVDQNFSTKVMNANASYSVGVNQFNPFVKDENKTGRWFEDFRMGIDVSGGYQATNNITSLTRSVTYTDYAVYGVENKPLTEEELRLQALGRQSNVSVIELNSLENIKKVFGEYGQFRTTYTVPISLPNFKLARYINLTPSVSYRGEIFTKQLNYTFIPKDTTINGKTYTGIDPTLGVVAIDTSTGIYNAYNTSMGLSMNTRVYGTFQFKRLGRLQAIRHTLAPSIGINYTPDLKEKFFQETQVRADDAIKKWLPKYPQLGSTPGANGYVSFSLSNQLEAKVRAKTDTAAKQSEKIMLLNNFGVSGGYNLLGQVLGDTMNLSTLSFSANSSLFKDLININTSASLDPYAYRDDIRNTSNLAGRRVSTFKWVEPGYNGAYFTNFQVSLSTRLSPKTFKKEDNKKTASSLTTDPVKEAMEKFVRANPLAYVDFSIPWSLNISYNYSFTKQGLADAQQMSAVQFTGDFSLTPKWKFNYSTGYDFRFKAATLTTLGVIRELHCWDMSFNWTPIAGNSARASTYSFDLKVRSSLLQDLKISRRRIYYDAGGF